MAIFVTGDTHGSDKLGFFSVDGYMQRLNMQNFPEQKTLSKKDYVIICGDFGGIWDVDREKCIESHSEKYGLDWLEKKSFTTLFIPGNHENYDRLTGIKDEILLNSWFFSKMTEAEKENLKKGYPQKEWNGGTVREIRPSVLMLEHGVFEIDGVKILTYGGAPSHDIWGGILNPSDYLNEEKFKLALSNINKTGLSYRVKGVSWWEQEIPDRATEEKVIRELENTNWEVDFVFTHDCSVSDRTLIGIHPDSEYDIKVAVFLELLKEKLHYKHWFFGHFHDNKNLPGGKEHLIYEQVIQIY